MKIESLTTEQESRMPEFAKKWIKAGLSTKTNREAAEMACRLAYKEGGLEEPKVILWAQSPLGLLMTLKLVRELKKKGVPPYFETSKVNVGVNVMDNVRANVWDNVSDNVGVNVMDNVRANVMDNVMDNVRANVRANVQSTSLRGEHNERRFDPYWDVNIFAFYDFFKEVCGLEKCKRLEPLSNLAKEVGHCFFFKDIAILSEKHTEIHFSQDNRLHNPSGPCMKWSDGYEFYALNGIRVPREIALLSSDEITKDTILKQDNADYRREIVRKLSGPQLLSVLTPKVLDEKYGYALLGIDLGDNRIRPFLKMINPSIEAIHIEGVRPGCDTVELAIEFRNGRPGYPITIDGFPLFTEEIGNYFQQGDCLFSIESGLPYGAVKCEHNIAGEGLIRHIQKGGELYDHGDDRYLVVEKSASINHPEHKDTVLAEGVYKISKVMEYDHWKEESRQVID